MPAQRPFRRPCSDDLFKFIFADPVATGPLRSFLGAVLGWPEADLVGVTVENTHLPAMNDGGKQGVLDVRVSTANGDSIDVEIQLYPDQGFPGRLAFYTSHMLVSQLRRGQGYSQLRQAICVGITDFTLIPDDVYHHRFRRCDYTQGVELTDVLQVDLLEMPKLPIEHDKTLLWYWLRFIGARNQEEVEMAAVADPAIAEAAAKARFFTAEEQAEIDETRQLIWMMERVDLQRYAREDGLAEGRAEGLAEGRAEGRLEGARQTQLDLARGMIAKGLPLETVADLSQLSLDEVAGLSRQA